MPSYDFVVYTDSVSARTILTQCKYGPISNLIFQEHYQSQRHSKSSIFSNLFKHFLWIFKKKFPKFMKVKQKLSVSQDIIIIILKFRLFSISNFNFFGGSVGAGAHRNTRKTRTQCGYRWAPKNSGCPCTLIKRIFWASKCPGEMVHETFFG